jgi:hypothetical protein
VEGEMVLVGGLLELSFLGLELHPVQVERLKMGLESVLLIYSQLEPIMLVDETKLGIFISLFPALVAQLLTRDLHDDHDTSVKVVGTDLISDVSSQDLPQLKKEYPFDLVRVLEVLVVDHAQVLQDLLQLDVVQEHKLISSHRLLDSISELPVKLLNHVFLTLLVDRFALNN